MTAVNDAQLERAALCDLLEAVGPDAPTLCEGWTTRDLAAHLVIRERRPDAAAGLVMKPLAAHMEKVRLAYAARPYEDLIAGVRNGPPRLSPQRIGALDRLTNTIEYFVHHEDVRRGAPGWQPRVLPAAYEARLRAMVSKFSKLGLKKGPAGITFVFDDGSRFVANAGQPTVEMRGSAGEIALFTAGRQAHTRVELDGPPELCDALRTADFGV